MFPPQQIMKDRWINTGSDEEALKPFMEPELDIRDQKRIGKQSHLIYFICIQQLQYKYTG